MNTPKFKIDQKVYVFDRGKNYELGLEIIGSIGTIRSAKIISITDKEDSVTSFFGYIYNVRFLGNNYDDKYENRHDKFLEDDIFESFDEIVLFFKKEITAYLEYVKERIF